MHVWCTVKCLYTIGKISIYSLLNMPYVKFKDYKLKYTHTFFKTCILFIYLKKLK